MSYDFSILVDTGGSEPHHIEPYFDDEHPAIRSKGVAGNAVATARGYARCGNYTSNVSGMWAKCLAAALERVPQARAWIGDHDRYIRDHHDRPDWKIETERLWLNDLHGKQAGEVVPLLRAAVEWGIEHLAELHADDPENGWGDADGAVTFLWDIQRFCETHPLGRLYISS